MAVSLASGAASSSLFAPSIALTTADHTSHRLKSTLQESRQFLSDTYTLWASLQKIVDDYEATAPATLSHLGRAVLEPPPPEQVAYYGRVARLYRDAIAKQLPLVSNDPGLTQASKQRLIAHYAAMHGTLALAEILYFPADGTGEGLVGEEVLDWVNTIDRAPSAEEGAELSSLSTPWDSPLFFPYLTRCLLRGHLSSASALLSLLSTSHPSSLLQKLGALLVPLLDTYPRSPSFRTEAAFLSALRSWKSTLAQSTKSAEALFAAPPSDGALDADEQSEWIAAFRELFSLLRGSESAVLSASEDWREALAAFALWVAPSSLRREDLPTTLSSVIVREHPVDPTLADEVAQSALLTGDVAGVLKALTGPYPWLATHLADLLAHLHLPAFDPPESATAAASRALMADDDDGEEEEEKEKQGAADDEDLPLGLREHFLLDWADRLAAADPEALWRLACEYWGACGAEGRRRARGLLKSLRLDEPVVEEEAEEKGAGGMEVDGEGEGEGEGEAEKENEGGRKRRKLRRVEEVLRVCADLGLENEMVGICQSYAAQLVARKRYGEAIAFSVRASDGRRIAEVAELILESYVEEGQDAFVAHVDAIPTSLLRPRTSTSPPASPSGSIVSLPSSPLSSLPLSADDALAPYSARLSFLARYRDFFALYAAGNRAEAAALLVLLLTSGVAPKRWWAVMLIDVLPLLETSPPLVSFSETFDLLRLLEDVVGPVVATSPPRDIFGHLDALGRLSERSAGKEKKGEKAKEGEEKSRERTARALEQMEVVRGALARHLALCCCL
ncbi:hypothetical protein JCM8097_003905 [Rhodosporidiobolus ruineniae]